MADETARAAALGPQALSLQVPEAVRTPGQLSLEYSDSDLDIVQQIGAKYDEQMKVWKHQGKTVLPQKRAKELVTHLHRWTHLGHKKLKALLWREGQTYYIPKLPSLIQQVTDACVPCAKVNAKHLKMPEGTRMRGERPGTNWEVDYTEIKPGRYGNKYLLIGDSVYVRRHQSRMLEPRWKGPYTVLLTTATALKVDGIAAWVHASHVKRAPSTSTADASRDGPDEPLQWKLHRTQNPLKIRLSKIVQ
ncbi:unnamed protein product [Nyctereutes procyonoides]|uniref:(raccoon dog) hypothetical protein n=1 Tax=Nyctereutes procyonoides TaxID=34880 RepID=A0A811XRZ1_NYCPR|nr:unnamed protein product [Nyctereutes procyonoides]